MQDFEAPPGALPPLLVKIHGGPTLQASTAFNLGIQYWTSRGGWVRLVWCGLVWVRLVWSGQGRAGFPLWLGHAGWLGVKHVGALLQ